MAKHRDSRISEELKKEISDILFQDIKDPDIGFVSIIKADVSHDLRVAKVYYSVIGDDEVVEKTQKAMKRSAGFIRRELAARMSLRYTPELVFIYDTSIEHGIKIAKILEDENKKHNANKANEENE
ncbi:MAG: 30S ribosome-binding factor RbfA [Firmicutes bacterium]|nr:30S ribosome-binding factor RbfA [Bacillota bacterium]